MKHSDSSVSFSFDTGQLFENSFNCNSES